MDNPYRSPGKQGEKFKMKPESFSVRVLSVVSKFIDVLGDVGLVILLAIIGLVTVSSILIISSTYYDVVEVNKHANICKDEVLSVTRDGMNSSNKCPPNTTLNKVIKNDSKSIFMICTCNKEKIEVEENK